MVSQTLLPHRLFHIGPLGNEAVGQWGNWAMGQMGQMGQSGNGVMARASGVGPGGR